MEEQFFTDQDNQNFETPAPQRPSGLTIWCVLSFINAVLQFLVNFISFVSFNMMKTVTTDDNYVEMMDELGFDMDKMESTLKAFLAPGMFYYLITALLYAASFVGVLYMWKLLKKGFHIYAIAQILLLIVTVIFVTGSSIWGSVILTAVWIGVYYLYYRRNMQ